MDIKKEIFNELSEIESAIVKLRGSNDSFKKQTDLEVAILKKQLEKRNVASEKIDGALRILEALK